VPVPLWHGLILDSNNDVTAENLSAVAARFVLRPNSDGAPVFGRFRGGRR
jgi:hypothetical protein